MNNDVLINEARRLYVVLAVEEIQLFHGNEKQLPRLERLLDRAYMRYQRRLNRCAVCYLESNTDCKRDMRALCCRKNRLH